MKHSRLAWRKARRSGGEGQCVEAAALTGAVAVRDSKNPDGDHVVLAPRHWRALLAGVKAGDHDLS